jgi:hypothetical protein
MDDPPTGQAPGIEAKSRRDWFSVLLIAAIAFVLLTILVMGASGIYLGLTNGQDPIDGYAGLGWTLLFWIFGVLCLLVCVALVVMCARWIVSERRHARTHMPRHARTHIEK